MDEKIFNELINSIQEGTLYDFICNNYTLFCRDDLASIIKEIMFTLYELRIDTTTEFKQQLTENLKESFEWSF